MEISHSKESDCRDTAAPVLQYRPPVAETPSMCVSLSPKVLTDQVFFQPVLSTCGSDSCLVSCNTCTT